MMTNYFDGVEVYWDESPVGAPVDMFTDSIRCGVLTCEHSSSSYGQPVLVSEDGEPIGTADLPAGAELHSRRGEFHFAALSDSELPDFDKLHQANPDSFRFSAEQLKAKRETILGAVRAGYRLAGLT